MGRNIASKETIENLISNSKKVISDSERMLYNAEFIKSKLCNNGLLTNYLQLLFDLLSGSILCIYEVCCDFKSLISTNNVYTKRYHIQMINLSQYEWCVFLRGKDKNGGTALHPVPKNHRTPLQQIPKNTEVTSDGQA